MASLNLASLHTFNLVWVQLVEIVTSTPRSHTLLCSNPLDIGLTYPDHISVLLAGTPMEVDQTSPPPHPTHVLHLLASLSSHPSLFITTLPAMINYLHCLAQEPFTEQNLELAIAASNSSLEAVQCLLAVEEHRVSELV